MPCLLTIPHPASCSYRGDDPNHPCRNCWKKYGRPYTAAMRIGLENPTSPVPPNYQRPLRLLQTPADRPTAPNVIGTTSGIPYVPLDTNTIVVRPGDPRIGKGSFLVNGSLECPLTDPPYSPVHQAAFSVASVPAQDS